MKLQILPTCFLLLFTSKFTSSKENEVTEIATYCEDLDCDGQINIVCGRTYVQCAPSSKCGQVQEPKPFNTCERLTVLEYHNEKRHILASSNDERLSESISNMNALSYSSELEYSAQCLTNTCRFRRAKCAKTPSFVNVYQNIYHADIYMNSYEDLERVLKKWFSEDLPSDPANITESNITNLVWAKATHIGCGRTLYGESPIKISVFYACFYSSINDKLTENSSLYTLGPWCSNCTEAKCNKKYFSLCGTELVNNTFDHPFLTYNSFASKIRLSKKIALQVLLLQILCVVFYISFLLVQ